MLSTVLVTVGGCRKPKSVATVSASNGPKSNQPSSQGTVSDQNNNRVSTKKNNQLTKIVDKQNNHKSQTNDEIFAERCALLDENQGKQAARHHFKIQIENFCNAELALSDKDMDKVKGICKNIRMLFLPDTPSANFLKAFNDRTDTLKNLFSLLSDLDKSNIINANKDNKEYTDICNYVLDYVRKNDMHNKLSQDGNHYVKKANWQDDKVRIYAYINMYREIAAKQDEELAEDDPKKSCKESVLKKLEQEINKLNSKIDQSEQLKKEDLKDYLNRAEQPPKTLDELFEEECAYEKQNNHITAHKLRYVNAEIPYILDELKLQKNYEEMLKKIWEPTQDENWIEDKNISYAIYNAKKWISELKNLWNELSDKNKANACDRSLSDDVNLRSTLVGMSTSQLSINDNENAKLYYSRSLSAYKKSGIYMFMSMYVKIKTTNGNQDYEVALSKQQPGTQETYREYILNSLATSIHNFNNRIDLASEKLTEQELQDYPLKQERREEDEDRNDDGSSRSKKSTMKKIFSKTKLWKRKDK